MAGEIYEAFMQGLKYAIPVGIVGTSVCSGLICAITNISAYSEVNTVGRNELNILNDPNTTKKEKEVEYKKRFLERHSSRTQRFFYPISQSIGVKLALNKLEKEVRK